MMTYSYLSKGKFGLVEKPKPVIEQERDAVVKVTLASICASDIHIKHGSVPRAVEGITVGHEMVGIVEEVGPAVTHVKPGDRVTVNVETYCGECYFCKHGFVNNCTDQNGGWALGCRIDGGQAEYVRVPFADQGLILPVGTISEETAAEVILDKDTVVLVYCRSGSRSKKAAQTLADLGYTQIYEFGGIRDWPYEIEK